MSLRRDLGHLLRSVARYSGPCCATVLYLVTAVAAQKTTWLRRLPRLAYPTDKLGAIGIGLADLDGDRDLDLVVGNVNFSATNEILLNDGFGRFTNVTATHFPKRRNVAAWGVGLADFDRDGDVDIFFGEPAGEGRKGNKLYINDGKAHFTDESATRLPKRTYHPDTHALAIADFDGDGDPDVLLGSMFLNVNKLLLYENDGKGRFTDVTFTKKALPVFGPPILDLATADIDGDGDADFIAGGFVTSTFLFVNDGKGRFTDESAKRLLPLPLKGTGFAEFGDVDGDGDADLVVGDIGFGAHLYLNDGKGVFREVPTKRFPRILIYTDDIKLFDADLDGDLDIFVFAARLGNKGGIHAAYENNGKGFFTDATGKLFPRLTPGTPLEVATGDIDGDGDTDVVFGNAGGAGQNTTWFNTARQLYPTQDAVLGKAYPIELYGPPGSQALLMIAGARGRLPVPPFGLLGLDLRSTTILPGTIAIGKTRRALFPGAIPNVTGLRGLSLHSQALLLDVRQLSRSRFTNPFADVIR